ncbi:MAG: AGE family epimerase/isomerase [Caldilineaceae bacterium]|uniref:AGE family epimerase/isomerase n=1 Tax=Caldilineaceae bacterium SB0662_bin_9 TaxID=2605258 RepID=A0A6B1DRL7_9CHLR|nr:AGE family epimerase/isomerase [Caldilineaceae bacterium]MYA04516.1 AGE family epimerase/isomerase [Caldilineaceae bacterium SB0664_bin_22]MYC64006.1 AGE family epimerase/isomerase [Caldilineaceae bacterium SB0661_bin_34]MYD89465.1 AGE family epimerase/isomerase [Caldilineaceae bacterium SB0662_bin_9]
MSYRDPEFLRLQMRSIISFYHPVCLDRELGGYINQLRDDGTVFDRWTKHLVGTCRFIYIYSLAALVWNQAEHREAAVHGLRFLQERHRQPDGGFAWELKGLEVADGTRQCYGHAFVLLAAAGATKAGLQGASSLIDEVFNLLENRFWEAEARLYVDEIDANDWNSIAPYRGQNANMHMCEAMLAAFEATGQDRFLARSHLLAKRICLDLADRADGLIWEHYRTDWTHDWDYNRDNSSDMFRPYGYLSGHFAEWAKLLLILERYRPEDWMLERARLLFDAAVDRCWDHEGGGMHYTFAPDGRILDSDRYYWVLSEVFAAAALLGLRTGEERYWTWYDEAWRYSEAHFIDHEHGGWYRILDADNNKYDDLKSPAAKTDYHPLSACYETLVALDLAANA